MPSCLNSQCISAITSLFDLPTLITLPSRPILVNDIVSPVFKFCLRGCCQCQRLISTGRYAAELLALTCSWGRFQHGVPCGHAIAVTKGYHDPAGGLHHSVCDFVAYNLTVPAFRATYTAPMLLVEIAGLQPRNGMLCRAPLFKKARGRPQVARLAAGERAHELLLSMGPYGTFRTIYTTPLLPLSPRIQYPALSSSACRPLNAGAAYVSRVGE